MAGWQPPKFMYTGLPEYIGRGAGCPVDIRLARTVAK